MAGDVLHGGAVLAAALGACCAAAERRSPWSRTRDAAMAVGMIVAMLGAFASGPGATVGWAVAIGALGLGMLPLARRADPGERAMVAYDAVGAVLMGSLMLVMGVGPVADAGSHHGAPPQTLGLTLAAAVLGYAAFSFAAARHARGWAGRVRPLAAGGSTLLMGVAALTTA